MEAIVCYTNCWSCITDCHFDPPKPHRWADVDDIEHARNTGQPEPTGNCACYCAKPTATVPADAETIPNPTSAHRRSQ